MLESPLIRRKGELLEAEVDDELVGLHVDKGTCYGFNATATRIWALLAEPKTLDQLCDALREEFDIDRSTCEPQVIALLRELETDGLVEIEGVLAPDAE